MKNLNASCAADPLIGGNITIRDVKRKSDAQQNTSKQAEKKMNASSENIHRIFDHFTYLRK